MTVHALLQQEVLDVRFTNSIQYLYQYSPLVQYHDVLFFHLGYQVATNWSDE